MTVSTPDGAPARVLVIGPPSADRDELSRDVEAEGFALDTADEAGDAFGRLQARRFDLVLLDAHLPGMNGPQFMRALLSNAELERVPIIVVSAVGDMDIVAQCLELGADDYLPASYRPSMLRARLRAAMDTTAVRHAESLRREMDVARNIQKDFLPETLPAARGLKLEAVLQPARDVSGDFYDAFGLAPAGKIVIVVGDVCDKGVGAALFMALFRSLIRASADPVQGGAIQMIGGRRTLVRESLEAASPADLLTRVAGFTNDYIARLHGRTNMFATVFMAALDPMTGQVDYVNAGHEPALIVAPDGSVQELRPTGPALGMMPDQQFTAGQGQLEQQCSLFAFTDGLVEARNAHGDAFGSARLHAALAANDASAGSVLQRVLTAVHAFSGSAEPHDDLTLLAATRTF